MSLKANDQSIGYTQVFKQVQQIIKQVYLIRPHGFRNAVGFSLSSVSINGKMTNESTVILEEGQNNISIQVTAEDGVTTKTYLLKVTREANQLSNDASLKSLSLLNTTISPVFNTATTAYTCTVAADTTQVVVNAQTSHANANLKFNNN